VEKKGKMYTFLNVFDLLLTKLGGYLRQECPFLLALGPVPAQITKFRIIFIGTFLI
jgi:hypothetical protein